MAISSEHGLSFRLLVNWLVINDILLQKDSLDSGKIHGERLASCLCEGGWVVWLPADSKFLFPMLQTNRICILNTHSCNILGKYAHILKSEIGLNMF